MAEIIKYAEPHLEAEFLGYTSLEISTGEFTKTIVCVSPSLRGIVISTAFELHRVFGVITIITSVLRTWEKEDSIYPKRVDRWGFGWQSGKPAGPHLFGRGIDWILSGGAGAVPVFPTKAYKRGVEYQNKYFPYGWNAPSRLIRAGRIKRLPYKTAISHDVGRGFHVHSQESWRG